VISSGASLLLIVVCPVLHTCCKFAGSANEASLQQALAQSQPLHVVTSYRSMVTRMRPPPEAILALHPGLAASMSARSFCSCPTNLTEEPSSQSRPSVERTQGVRVDCAMTGPEANHTPSCGTWFDHDEVTATG